jgi:hypothetical protein
MTCPESAPSSGGTWDSHWKDRLGSWSVYAAAAAATLATASSAEANIIYTHPASPVEAKFSNYVSHLSSEATARFTINGAHGLLGIDTFKSNTSVVQDFATINFSGAQVFRQGLFYLRKFAAGALIDSRYSRYLTNGVFVEINFNGGPRGLFTLNIPGFGGFKTAGGDLGWIRVEVLDRNQDGYGDAIEAIDWAYNNTPGAPINAGQVPEPGSLSLALLATGATGLLAWRRRQNLARDENRTKQN